MKKILSVILISYMFTPGTWAQATKVDWTTTSKKLPNGNYEIHFTAKVPLGYHIYSQHTGEGPVATNFSFGKNALISVEGKVKEAGKMVTVDDEVWGNKQKYYFGKVDFVQIIKPKTKIKTNVTGNIEYMICDDKKCLPPTTYPFNVALN